jgi:hypothetical protein
MGRAGFLVVSRSALNPSTSARLIRGDVGRAVVSLDLFGEAL